MLHQVVQETWIFKFEISRIHCKFYFTGEKVVKKKTLCTRMMASSLTSDAVTELILLSKGQRKPPMGYTLVGYGKYFLRRNCNRKWV
jgi:hypothetical protein